MDATSFDFLERSNERDLHLRIYIIDHIVMYTAVGDEGGREILFYFIVTFGHTDSARRKNYEFDVENKTNK